MIGHVLDDPSFLSPRAQRFVREHGRRLECWSAGRHREHWLGLRRPVAVVDRLVAFQARWGGLQLPAVAEYDGGPLALDADDPHEVEGVGLCFEAAETRTALPYLFCIDRHGRFGILGDTGAESQRWVPLHASVEGWVEAAALEHEARRQSEPWVTSGHDVIDRLSERFGSLTPVPEVTGLADGWWRGEGVIVGVFTGEARVFGMSQYRRAYVYEQSS